MIRTLLIVLGLTSALVGTAESVELQKLNQDTLRSTTANSTATIVWWLPTEFWDAATATNAAVTPQTRAQVTALVDDYVIFALVRARISLEGVQATPRDELLRSARLEINGQSVPPLPVTELKPGAQAILAAMKPIFASFLGSFGQSMEFVFYPNSLRGRRLVDAGKEGNMKYALFDQTYTWRLPLGSLLPPRRDARTGEEFPGNYQFNPFTGDRLR
jgi:hypothetical protein